MPNYPVLKEKEQKGAKYRVMTWPSFGGADANVIFNQTYAADEALGEAAAHQGLPRGARPTPSTAIRSRNRPSSGLGEARQPIPAPWHPYYPGDQYAKKYTEFKPDEANKLLDGIGLNKKDAEGYPPHEERQAA